MWSGSVVRMNRSGAMARAVLGGMEQGDLFVDELARRSALVDGRLGDVDRVLVSAGQEAGVVADHPVPARDRVGRDHLVQGVQTGLVVGIRDRGGQVEARAVGHGTPMVAARGTLAPSIPFVPPERSRMRVYAAEPSAFAVATGGYDRPHREPGRVGRRGPRRRTPGTHRASSRASSPRCASRPTRPRSPARSSGPRWTGSGRHTSACSGDAPSGSFFGSRRTLGRWSGSHAD